MKKYVFIVSIIILAFMCPSISFAENKTILSMEELSIQVMPEFAYHPNEKKKDHAPLLIGYQGSMVNNSVRPQKGQIEIPLPIGEKNFQIGYVADYSSDLRKAYEIEYVIDREKGTISWTTSEEIRRNEHYKFVIEYYTDSLKVNNVQKSLAYQFKSFADIGIVNITFTKPANAKKVKLSPAPKEGQTHADGKDTLGYFFQNVKAGEEKNFTLSYERSETKPTIEVKQSKVQNIEDKNTNNIAIGAFSGVSIISVGALTILIRNRKKNQ